MAAVSERSRAPSDSTSPSLAVSPVILEKGVATPRGRASIGSLLRRSKSRDQGYKPNKKQQAAAREQELLLLQQAIAAEPKAPTTLPVLYNGAAPPVLETFGGDEDQDQSNYRPDSIAIATGRTSGSTYRGRTSVEPRRTSVSNQMAQINEAVDPYARTESMTHRGRHSYSASVTSSVGAGINGPRRVRRRKDPTPFNILIIGTQNSGKTSFLNFLKTSLALPAKKRTTARAPSESRDDEYSPKPRSIGSFVPHYLETEIDGERIGLTIWDSEGLEKSLVDLQLRDMSAFLESKFEETFTEEMKVVRAPGAQDTHIHCAFLLLDPARLDKNIATVKARLASVLTNGRQALPNAADKIFGGLDEDLDLNVIKAISQKTTVVPVIPKADSITTAHMSYLKRTVWDSLKKSDLDPLEALGLDDDTEVYNNHDNHIREEDEDSDEYSGDSGTGLRSPSTPTASGRKSKNRQSAIMESPLTAQLGQDSPFLPFSIISPDLYEPEVLGRRFPWGFADPFNAEHCDFVRLKESIFLDWRGELRGASREIWYERWRTARLDRGSLRR